jgi:beta-lactamase regulating signal transducer with metallopeptidase domain
MTELGPVLFVLAIQVTLPVVGGLLLSRRRDPAAACGPLVVAAAAVILLTPLPFLPRPEWPTSSASEAAPAVAQPAEPLATNSEAPGGIDLMQLLRLPHPEPAAHRTTGFDGWKALAYVLMGLSAFGLARLLIGLVNTARAVRAARPVTDPKLLDLADEVRVAVGCRRTVRLRELAQVGTAATAGWRRPVILVSPHWRRWTAAERRAVLAHEFAHVARGDFAARLVGRLAVAVHGYHPLVRWLVARLTLRQEVAADARAARLCGGPAAYLKCLAALALKADARPVGLAPTFLSRPRTLLRRIAMLRVTDDTVSSRRRWPAYLGVLLLATGALALHGRTPEALAGPIIPAKFVEKKERPPLDISLILPSDHPDQVGVYAIRLGELFRTPGMDKMAELYAGAAKMLFGDKMVHFEITDVEQLCGRVTLTHDPKKPAPNRSLQMSLTSVRMAKDFDWVKQLKAWGSDWKEHTHAGVTYYSAKMSVPALGFKDTTCWFYLPDARTAVLESETNIKALIDRKGKAPAQPLAGDWKAIEGGMMGLVLTDVKGKLAKKLPSEKETDVARQDVLPAITGICTRASRATIGLEVNDGFSARVRLACATGADAAAVDEACQVLVRLAEKAIDAEGEPTDAVGKAGKKFSTQLVTGVEFGTTFDHVVEIRMTATTGLADLIKAFGADGAK